MNRAWLPIPVRRHTSLCPIPLPGLRNFSRAATLTLRQVAMCEKVTAVGRARLLISAWRVGRQSFDHGSEIGPSVSVAGSMAEARLDRIEMLLEKMAMSMTVRALCCRTAIHLAAEYAS